MKRLWFFTSSSNSDNSITNDQKDTLMVPTDWISAKYLESRNIKYVLPENYVDRSEYVWLDKAVESIATNWWKKVHFKNLQYREIPLGYLLEWEFHITLAKFLKQLVEFNAIVSREKPDMLIGSSGNNMFTKIQKFMADNYGIEYLPIASEGSVKSFHMDIIPITFKIGSKPITIHLTQSQFKYASRIINKLTRLLSAFGRKAENKKLLMLDFNIVQYSNMLDGLADNGLEVLLLNKRRPTVWNLESLKIEVKRRYKFASLDEYADSASKMSVKSATKEINKTIDELWENGGFEDQFSINGINFWKVFRDDFKEFCKSRMSQSIEDIEYGNNFFDHNQTDMIIVWGYVLPFEKVMLRLGKKRGIPSLAIQHGVLTDLRDKNGDWTFLESHNSDADIIAAWGRRGKDWFVKNGISKERVFDIGSPRYDVIYASRNRTQHNTNNIILATSGLPTSFSAYNTISTAMRYEEFIREICIAIKKFPEKRLIVKLHPFADEVIDVISIIKSVNPDIRIAKNENIIELILNSDLLISTYSSVVLESMILGKPTIVFDALDDMFEPVHLPYAKSGASLRIQQPNEIRFALERFFSDSSLQEELVKASSGFVTEYLSNLGNSIDVLSSHILRKLNN